MRFLPATPHGFSRAALRERRRALGWDGLCQIHHVVPRSLAAHPTLARFGYDVEGEYNFALLPTRLGAERMRLRPERPLHDGGHLAYNAFARSGLDRCATGADLALLLVALHRGCRGLARVPWR